MQAPRPVLLLPLLLALPTAAAFTQEAFIADPLPADFPIPATALVVDYEGTITAVSEAPPKFRVGDSISGRILIDRSLARPLEPSPGSVTYASDDPTFVRGFWIPGSDGFDRVSLHDELVRLGTDRPVDIFHVEDWWVTPMGSLDGALVFSLDATLHDFLDDVSLEQSFELTSADVDEPHEGLSGGFRFSNFGPFAFVSFALDRLSVKPGRCFAPT